MHFNSNAESADENFSKRRAALNVNQIYTELGELIKAVGTTWFSNTLPAVLQCVFQYDYYLLAKYEKGQPLHIIRSDFRDLEMKKTLHYLVTETYVAEPIF